MDRVIHCCKVAADYDEENGTYWELSQMDKDVGEGAFDPDLDPYFDFLDSLDGRKGRERQAQSQENDEYAESHPVRRNEEQNGVVRNPHYRSGYRPLVNEQDNLSRQKAAPGFLVRSPSLPAFFQARKEHHSTPVECSTIRFGSGTILNRHILSEYNAAGELWDPDGTWQPGQNVKKITLNI